MIPSYNASNVLPPFKGATPDSRADQSPFQTTMVDVVKRFGTSPERDTILSGLLDFREVLRDLGYIDGYQWIDGSFVENVEISRGRPPGDADVVTVSNRPQRMTPDEFERFADTHFIFDRRHVKDQYKLDAIFIDLNIDGRLIVEDVTFYFSLFSHQRESFLWKGMLSVPLLSDDEAARALLLEAGRHAAAA
ncbi:hypothetical protein [Methylobacterium sp. Leaf100]|uniref:DUF6932 family protein n=1 Tax=Methylobacterium sp. Leaf100 TaxID=1736252 RepID=UPI0009EAA904|nr:hypothetical protein [Methylobacterium sp. Leaf100]